MHSKTMSRKISRCINRFTNNNRFIRNTRLYQNKTNS